MAPLVHALARDPDIEAKVCVTAQHREMLESGLNPLSIVPDYNLNIMKPGQGLTEITCRILQELKPILESFRPDVVLVHGDTTTTVATSLAAFYQRIPVGHIEAGLRTGNLYSPWPERGQPYAHRSPGDVPFCANRELTPKPAARKYQRQQDLRHRQYGH